MLGGGTTTSQNLGINCGRYSDVGEKALNI
jgi:hypothetical protein